MPAAVRPLLGQILLDAGLIRPAQLEAARRDQQRSHLRLGQALMLLGYATEDDVAWALGRQLHLPYVHLTPDILESLAVSRLPLSEMERFDVIPILESPDGITVVMADPTDEEALAMIAEETHLPVIAAIGLASNIRAMVARLRTDRDEAALGRGA